MPRRTPLSIYLGDHLAGATAGVNLAQRLASGGEGPMTDVAAEIEADRQTLRQLMSDLGIHPSRLKNAAAWLAERADRLKPNGGPPMQRLHELETLSIGIAGKLALWEALRVVSDVSARSDVDLDALAERARSQRERVEAERMACARAALAPGAVHRVREERPA